MNNILIYLQIAISLILIVLVVLQQRGAALGSAFGGGGEFYSSRRGAQKKLHYATILASATFIILGILNLLIS